MNLPRIRRRSKKAKAAGLLRSTPVKLGGALAVLAGLGAAVARTFKGGGEPDPFEQAYEPADAAAATNGGSTAPLAAAED